MIVCQILGQKKDFTTHLYLSDSLLRNFRFINIEENLRRGVRVDAVVLRKIWRYDGDMAGYWWRVGRGRYRRAIKMKITNEKTVSKTQSRVEAAKHIATVSEVRRAVNDHTLLSDFRKGRRTTAWNAWRVRGSCWLERDSVLHKSTVTFSVVSLFIVFFRRMRRTKPRLVTDVPGDVRKRRSHLVCFVLCAGYPRRWRGEQSAHRNDGSRPVSSERDTVPGDGKIPSRIEAEKKK